MNDKEPVPFMGWVDLEDTVEMLRKQIEIQGARMLEMASEIEKSYKKGWNDAIDAALKKVKDI
jgi:hypothetical protein